MSRLRLVGWAVVGAVGLVGMTSAVLVAPRLVTTSGVAPGAPPDAREELLSLLTAARTQTYHARYTADAPERQRRSEELVVDVWRRDGRYRIDTTVRSAAGSAATADVADASGRVTSCERTDRVWDCRPGVDQDGEDPLDGLLARVARESSGSQVLVDPQTRGGRPVRCFSFRDGAGEGVELCLTAKGVTVSLVSGDSSFTLQSLSPAVQERDVRPPG